MSNAQDMQDTLLTTMEVIPSNSTKNLKIVRKSKPLNSTKQDVHDYIGYILLIQEHVKTYDM